MPQPAPGPTIGAVAELTLFLDDGDVLSDNSRRGEQWRRLCGEFFPGRLGGEPRDWAEANGIMFEPIFDAYRHVMAIPDRYLEGERAYERAWLTAMCEYLGIEPPAGDACPALAREAMIYITSRVEGAFPWTRDVVEELSGAGYTLHTASNQTSWEMGGYLRAMGLEGSFGIHFGADLVNAVKPAAAYYARAFVIAGVEPSRALVVDDTPDYLRGAQAVGARTVLCGPREAPPGMLAIASLAELPALLREGAAGA